MDSQFSLAVGEGHVEQSTPPGLQDDLTFLERCCASASTEPPVVLVATGSFCPPHRGHLEMMQAAKEALGPNVIPAGAIMVPSADSYISHKRVPLIPFELRSQLLKAMASDLGIGSWVHVSDAEHERSEFYLEVLGSLAHAVCKRWPLCRALPKLVFVTGSDRPGPLYEDEWGMSGVVVVPRAGDRLPRLSPELRGDPLRCVAPALAGSAAALSSTQLRGLVQLALAAESRGGSAQDAVEAAVRDSMLPSAAALYASDCCSVSVGNKRQRSA